MRVLDLFSGIGAFSFGLERAGMKTAAFCEIDPYCRRVLARHWPGVPIYEDVKELTAKRLRRDGIAVDLICGGFPCQDISVAGPGGGLDGTRSGLWWEYRRIIEELRPEWVVVENVDALRGRGLDTVLLALDALGYVGEWHLIPASAVGAPHRRDRLWIIAHSRRSYRRRIESERRANRRNADAGGDGPQRIMADAAKPLRGRRHDETHPQQDGSRSSNGGSDMAYAYGGGRREQGYVVGSIGDEIARQLKRGGSRNRWWAAEPDVGRVVNGPAEAVDRRKRLIALGNALVPQIPEMIGRVILRVNPLDTGLKTD
jgi:DNA (cytosine-5)-methyltransferase 1